MLLHRFIVPVRDNANLPLDREHNHLRNWLITQFGGYTVSDCAGGWRDDNGRVYLDQCKAYDVALSDDIADLCVGNVLARLACVFIDQKCFAHARIGEMHFHEPIEHFRG